ncbi:MAG: hypothetical protein EBZ50_15765 [Alphaproteobacteria bacterium]|jgi:dolichol kinase|nr:hypothetical protein [Alphaproteobacteria bacterium]
MTSDAAQTLTAALAPDGKSSWGRIALAAAAALIGVVAFLVVAAAAVAVAIVGAVVAAIAMIGRKPARRAPEGVLEGRRTADGWTVEPAR